MFIATLQRQDTTRAFSQDDSCTMFAIVSKPNHPENWFGCETTHISTKLFSLRCNVYVTSHLECLDHGRNTCMLQQILHYDPWVMNLSCSSKRGLGVFSSVGMCPSHTQLVQPYLHTQAVILQCDVLVYAITTNGVCLHLFFLLHSTTFLMLFCLT